MSKIIAEYIDHMGSDLTVVNAAKVSFNKQSKWIESVLGVDMTPTKTLSPNDTRLIEFLARGCTQKEWTDKKDDIINLVIDYHYNHQDIDIIYNDLEEILKHIKNMPTHFTPFTHEVITIRETVPIFVSRQRFKHMIGFSYNEVSRRYVDDTPEFFIPDNWRARAENKKQGSDYSKNVLIIKEHDVNDVYNEHIKNSITLYENMLNSGVAPEQARMVLPQSMMTTYYVTGSLYAFARAYNQRHDRNHAQGEIADLADIWKEIISPLYPISWKALTT